MLKGLTNQMPTWGFREPIWISLFWIKTLWLHLLLPRYHLYLLKYVLLLSDYSTLFILFQEAESNRLCRRLQLKDIIPVEMQRLTKYPLLLENIAKYTGTVEFPRNNVYWSVDFVHGTGSNDLKRKDRLCDRQNPHYRFIKQWIFIIFV